VEWQNLWNFQERRWAENFHWVQSFLSCRFQILSNKMYTKVRVIITGSRTSPVISDSLYPQQA
jgi:hypothetical protein